MKAKKLFYGAIFILIVVVALSCAKSEYPRQFTNFKATDCTYYLEGDLVHFTYEANNPLDESYKRMSYNGFCNKSDVKEWREEYLWIMKATITSGGVIYVE